MSNRTDMDKQDKLRQIVRQCQRGEQAGFDLLIDMYKNRCFGYFYRLTGDTHQSEDLLSELFVKLVRKIGLYKSGSFETWLFTMASNLFKDHLRRQYRQKKHFAAKAKELSEIKPEPKNQMADMLQEKLSQLNPEIAELLVARFYGQQSFKELSQCPNKRMYSWDEKQLKKIWNVIEHAYKKCKDSYENTEPDEFSF